MARDYKNAGSGRGKPKGKAKAQRASGRPGMLLGLFIGLVIGLFIALLVHLYHLGAGPQRLVERPQPPAPSQQPAEQQAPADERPRFEFYKLLPEQEVVVPPPEQQAEPQRPAPSREPKAGERYLLQAGSFQKHQDADRLKAQLALLGVEADIQTVKLASGETWHRVRIGPFSDRERLNATRRQLQANGIETILLKHSG